MCGIAGILGQAAAHRDVRTLVDAIAHRGPDNQSTFKTDGVQFGHVRLSIIDVSHGSDQPMTDEASGNVIIYNGELYNFHELKADLAREGVRFRTKGDTEVILKGYGKHGPAFFERLNGIFAFAIWDAKTRQVLLLRDPVGIKPLAVCRLPDGLAFSSETKALYGLNGPVQLDLEALAGYFRFHFNPLRRDLVAGIEKMPPGELWTVDLQGTVTERRALRFVELATPRPVDAAGLWAELEASVERQMIADVPVGTFLSGGLDSTIITALAARHAKPLHTFTVGFDAVTDERPQARAVAESLGATIHEVEVDGESVLRDLGTISWHFDAPVAEQGAIPNYYVSREAARHVKVVLAGEGADELFGGYPQDGLFPKFEKASKLIPPMRWVTRTPGLRGQSLVRMGASAVTGPSKLDRYQLYYEWMTAPELESGGLVPPPLLPAWPEGGSHLDVGRLSQMTTCYLEKADRMTMAHGLEERVPFLDLRLLAAARSIPMHEKLGPPEKKVLRDAARGHIPTAAAKQKKKGYGVPTDHWMATSWKSRVREELEKPHCVESGLVPRKVWDAVHRVSLKDRRFPRVGLQLLCLDRWSRELEGRVNA